MAIRELRSGVSGFRIFLACLILGVGTISAIGTVKSGIEIAISEKGSELLGGNAEAEFTYRLANTEELKWLEAISQIYPELLSSGRWPISSREVQTKER